MIAEIISIGNELTTGQTVDTNAPWLAARLAEFGVTCTRQHTVADELAAIHHVIATASQRANLVLITGGLGPTPDDLTRLGLAQSMGVELDFHEESYRRIEAYFRLRKRPMHEGNRQQAMIPQGAEVLANERGTAPGMFARHNDSRIYCMPGVPTEMTWMFDTYVVPMLQETAGEGVILRSIMRTFGMSESEVGEKLADLMRRDRNPTIGTSAADLIISIRILASGQTRVEAEALMSDEIQEIRERLGQVVYGEGDDTLATAVGKRLIEAKQTVATAESCTGGLIAKRLTDIPGSSAYLKQGFVTYANEAKISLLGVSEDDIHEQGAVSETVALQMAANCRERSGTDYAIGVTGIAGPGGGTKEKPVGLVFVALASPDGETKVKEFRFGDNLSRKQIRDRTAKAALNWLRRKIETQTRPGQN